MLKLKGSCSRNPIEVSGSNSGWDIDHPHDCFPQSYLEKCRINRLVCSSPRPPPFISLITHLSTVILSTLYGLQYWRRKINHKGIQVLKTYSSYILKFWFLFRNSFETVEAFIVTASTWNSITIIQALSVLCFSLTIGSDCFPWFGDNFSVWLRCSFLFRNTVWRELFTAANHD
jgi:hypothetical protein